MSYAISSIRDDFENNTIDPLWSTVVTGSATAAETSAQARLTLPSSTAGSHLAYYVSTASYDLTGDGFFWNIGTMVATGVAATATLDLFLDASNILRWQQVSNAITARKVAAGVDTQLFTATWSSSTYKYLRIREAGGTIFFDSSTNGTSWTNRASIVGLPFAVTALFVQFGASCGNVASPGSLRLDDVNQILPAPSSTWRYTTADWSITNRLRPVTLASTSNAVGVLVTADTMDSSAVLGGTVRYFAGPLGSSSGGYLQATEYASLALAQASAFPIPVDGRVDLPAMVDARYMRLYHRSSDASAHTLREFVPRRIVQADDIEAESIRAINISAGAVTADKIFVLTLGAITANIGKLNIDTTGYIYQGTGTGASPTTGLKIFNSGGIGKLSTYNTGVEQVTFDTDGLLKAGAGAVQLDANGIGIIGDTALSDIRSYKFYKSDGVTLAGRMSSFENAAPAHNITVNSESVTGDDSSLSLGAYAPSGKLTNVFIRAQSGIPSALMTLTTSGGTPTVAIAASGGTTISSGGLNMGTATGASTGQIATSGSVGIGIAVQSNVRLDIKGASSTSADYSFLTANSAAATMIAARNDGLISIAPSGGTLQFFGGSGGGQPTVTGSRAGNAALASLLTGLAGMGLIVNSSTA